MTDRERLIKLLIEAKREGSENAQADYLLANGVFIAKPTQNDFCGVLCDFAEDIINRQKAEIERLTELEQGCYVTGYKNIKAEAVKEFAERLKEWAAGAILCIDEWDVDNLVKEMVGDEE